MEEKKSIEKTTMQSFVGNLVESSFLDYDTKKMVKIHSPLIGMIQRIIQLVILIYTFVWVIMLNKGYQEFSSIDTSVTTKIKGSWLTNFSRHEINSFTPLVYNQLWDDSDYVIPPQLNSAFFIMTNAIITPNQTQSVCSEASRVGYKCKYDKHCPIGYTPPNGNGPHTGECDIRSRTCKIFSWCPVERDLMPVYGRPLIEGWLNFTVLIKNHIEFSLFRIKTRNIAHARVKKQYLKTCVFNAKSDPLCPKFTMGTIIKEAKQDPSIALLGGIIAIVIKWNCNLDFHIRYCLPAYEFRRLDDPYMDTGKGWNFRFAKYFDHGKARTLYKAFGVLFIIMVQGEGGKFSTIPLLMKLGSGLGLMAIPTIICDMLLLRLSRKRKYYQDHKFLVLSGRESDVSMRHDAV